MAEDRMQPIYRVIQEMGVNEIIGTAEELYFQFNTDIERAQVKGFFLSRASDISAEALKNVKNLFKAIEKKEKDALLAEQRQRALDGEEEFWESLLERDEKGRITETLTNYTRIMEFDPYYSGIRYNLLRSAPEKHSVELGKVHVEDWKDADEANSLQYIEEKYKIYSDAKHFKALTSLYGKREYNPVVEIINKLEWDGTERISDFLHRWMKCEDNPYTREVSRLIFAGGINRLYEPGCKFDEVPVLVGTRQAEGKTTIVNWLAIEDKFKNDVTQFDGQQAIEQLEGAWICEITELLALNKLQEQESAKAFITRQTDKYRRPWGRNTVSLPRRCIFIGTTNDRRFLKDKTGNRRYYPVEVFSNASDLRDHEQECREYVLQCWAEARVKYAAGKMPPYPDSSLAAEFEKAQNDAMEDDWREGAIVRYLSTKKPGDRVCARQIAREAFPLSPDELPKDPTRKESQEIGKIMERFPGWKRISSFNCGSYGYQRGWEKFQIADDEPAPELPFPV